MGPMISKYGLALAMQLLHLVLCAVWNGVGLWQKAQGLQSIGPTASSLGVILSIVIAGVLVFLLAKSHESIYLALSFVPLVIAVLTIYGGFTQDLSNWPSEFWRWAGILVNTIGLIGFGIAIATYLRRNRNIV